MIILTSVFLANKKPIYHHKQQVDIGKVEIPIFSSEMFKTNNLPISTKIEAKKSYKIILAKYRIVRPHELSLYADQISQEIEDHSYNLQDNVNFNREKIRNIKSDIREAENELKDSDTSEVEDITAEIKDMKIELLEAEQDLQKAIQKRDEFKRDKSDFIARQVNILAHGNEWDVNIIDSKYFIYKDSSGSISARHIINFRSNAEYIEGFCKTREDKRTFRKDRILEYASSLEDLEFRYMKYPK
jgi:septal ring factor EnvC (AmiA/AmiB activator)